MIAEVVLPGSPLEETLAFFTETLGFRVASVRPAEDPAVVVVVGHGLRVRLDREMTGAPGVLRITCREPLDSAERIAPNGTRIDFVAADPAIVVPPLHSSLAIGRRTDGAWKVGRAGMRYRDLIPGRQGGRFGASHIRITEGGPVSDYVHYHRVRFQMIFCYKGWARLVYEDQGPEFVFQAGDCILQPPEIRHRVLETSPGFEVIEVSSPAHHETLADLDLTLPTEPLRPDRDFAGQNFLHHRAADAEWNSWRSAGFEARPIGIARQTNGVGEARVARCSKPRRTEEYQHDGELLFTCILEGSLALDYAGKPSIELAEGDSFVIPPHEPFSFSAASNTELLEVMLPAP